MECYETLSQNMEFMGHVGALQMLFARAMYHCTMAAKVMSPV